MFFVVFFCAFSLRVIQLEFFTYLVRITSKVSLRYMPPIRKALLAAAAVAVFRASDLLVRHVLLIYLVPIYGVISYYVAIEYDAREVLHENG